MPNRLHTASARFKMGPMISANTATAYIVLYSIRIGHPASKDRLQALLYLAQGHALRLNGTALFSDHIFAGDNGPVVPEVYGRYCNLKGSITNAKNDLPTISEKDKALIRETVSQYNLLSDEELGEAVRGTDPWRDVHGSGPNGIIRKVIIGEYFREHLEL